MKIISIQVYFEGICISQTTVDKAKVYFKDPTYFCILWREGHRDPSFLQNKYLENYKTLKI